MNSTPFIKFIGIIFAIVGIFFIYQSVADYVETCNQKDWETTSATVVNVEKRYEKNGIKSNGRKLVYDVYYEYAVNNKTYSGTILSTTDYSKQIGSSFQIKYDPHFPDESTHILFPSVSGMISGIISSCFFIFFSLFMIGIIKFPIKKKRKASENNLNGL